ncbi:MAG: hypothetical protein HQL81_07030 [Magnetococcales bacterium]|nr:hypothetical protein [Magnetococcales bacterium]
MFRLDASHRVGLGHLRRCLVLAMAIRESGGMAEFLLGDGSQDAGIVAKAQGFTCHILDAGIPLIAEVDWIATHVPEVPDVVVIDISHDLIFAHVDQLSHYCYQLKKMFGRLVVFDGYYSHSMRSRVPDLCADMVIAPYCGERVAEHGLPYRTLIGPQFFPMDPVYAQVAREPRFIKEEANRILVSCGGSDPLEFSLKVLLALEEMEGDRLQVCVVVGPGFSPSLTTAIRTLIGQSRHQIIEVMAPENLSEWMVWCDVAVSLSGLTKYELAATGTPAILLSINDLHAQIHAAFEAERTAWHLGVCAHIEGDALGRAVLTLLRDWKQRREMSERGRKLLDGSGALRIIGCIDALCVTAPSTGSAS